MKLSSVQASVFLFTTIVAAAGVSLTTHSERVRINQAPWEETVSFCPGKTVTPDILFCDDFEDQDYQKRWDIGGHQGRWPVNDFVKCDHYIFGYHSSCAAWSNFLTFDHAWGWYGYDARHSFPPQSEFYVRWYQYISDPFTWGTLEDKSVMLHDQANTLVTYVATNRNQLPEKPNSGPGVPYVANYQDIDTPETANRYERINRFQNQGKKFALIPGHWYLFEWYLKLNTPGESDGITRLWIDEASDPVERQTLRMEYRDMRFLKRSDAGKQFGVVRLTVYHQRCDIEPSSCPPKGPELLQQYQRWDHLVVSRAPIGPLKTERSLPVR